jgi:hypothetical protein
MVRCGAAIETDATNGQTYTRCTSLSRNATSYHLKGVNMTTSPAAHEHLQIRDIPMPLCNPYGCGAFISVQDVQDHTHLGSDQEQL